MAEWPNSNKCIECSVARRLGYFTTTLECTTLGKSGCAFTLEQFNMNAVFWFHDFAGRAFESRLFVVLILSGSFEFV